MWIAEPDYSDTGRLGEAIANAVRNYSKEYENYRARHRGHDAATTIPPDVLPQVILMPGLGALCVGKDAEASTIARDITAHTLAVKTQVAALGTYQGLREHELYEMEYRSFQQAKLGESDEQPLAGHVGLVTGAAGAIGSAICEALLRKGCHVAATDLPGEHLDLLVEELKGRFGSHAIGVPLDVTASQSVSEAFTAVIRSWGGLDLVVINAALAHVAPLADLNLEAFRRLEQVNVEGTLLVLAESARHFTCQASGGDIVVVSTKNVFAPGAGFGAYSATKAAAHQLARIASLELANLDVRVNMVAPDAVFSHRTRRSGLWAAVGPDRMRARGLDEAGLEEYYRGRSLLKIRVTAEDCGQRHPVLRDPPDADHRCDDSRRRGSTGRDAAVVCSDTSRMWSGTSLNVHGGRRAGRCGQPLEIRIHHHRDQLPEIDCLFPPQMASRFRGVADEVIDFRRAQKFGIGANVLAPVEADVAECQLDKIAHGMADASGNDKILRLVPL